MCGPYLDPDTKKLMLILVGLINGIVACEGGAIRELVFVFILKSYLLKYLM